MPMTTLAEVVHLPTPPTAVPLTTSPPPSREDLIVATAYVLARRGCLAGGLLVGNRLDQIVDAVVTAQEQIRRSRG